MVTFPEEINPKKKIRLKFDYEIRAYQYLNFFNIIKLDYACNEFKFSPLNITFSSYEELNQFLKNKGIVTYEMEYFDYNENSQTKYTIIDTNRIFECEEFTLKYLLNFKYYSVNELAQLLSMSRPTIYKLVNSHKIKSIRINGQLRVNHRDLMEYINPN